ncbi:integrase catalytic domain-containing protein [Trichonephila inaurata madagascariensis]|uniref:Integrase catalytic domain-containing protein n=1 Tax=Trichonephila inaurata madagascariensis TaxID=2747483 RepID=A0A8X6I6I4_9ARAC|nr:integrase catalytic domain-containing protein [Trichonephila inaurata madagascariensis]
MPLEDKRKLLVQKHACFRCLKIGHVSRSCKNKVKCLYRDKNHYTIMCTGRESAKSNDENTVVSSSVLSNQSVINETVYLQTLVLKLEHNGVQNSKEFGVRGSEDLFVDACKSSYGACVCIRTVTPLGVKMRLIRARSRVAPLKTLIIPWLELVACCIGARLVHSVYAALDVPDLKNCCMEGFYGSTLVAEEP